MTSSASLACYRRIAVAPQVRDSVITPDEPRAGDLGPFAAVRGQGGCRDVGQGGVQLGQFEAPRRLRLGAFPLRGGDRDRSFSPRDCRSGRSWCLRNAGVLGHHGGAGGRFKFAAPALRLLSFLGKTMGSPTSPSRQPKYVRELRLSWENIT